MRIKELELQTHKAPGHPHLLVYCTVFMWPERQALRTRVLHAPHLVTVKCAPRRQQLLIPLAFRCPAGGCRMPVSTAAQALAHMKFQGTVHSTVQYTQDIRALWTSRIKLG